jgi:hypothetical protein
MPRFPPGVHLKGGRNAAVTNAQAAREFYAPLLPVVLEVRRQGLSLRAIAAELGRRGIKSRQEWPHWSATSVRRVLVRAEAQGRGVC